MKTIKITTQEELASYRASGEKAHLDMKKWKGGDINLRGAKTGDIDLREATTGDINLRGAKTGDIDLREATTGDIDLREATTGNINLYRAKTGDINLREATTGDIIQNYTKEDIELLKSIPYDVFDMSEWQSNDNWKQCTSEKELHSCGTTFCIRGYAEALYFVKNGKEIEDKNLLHPNLKHLFYMTNEQAKEEIQKILSKYENN